MDRNPLEPAAQILKSIENLSRTFCDMRGKIEADGIVISALMARIPEDERKTFESIIRNISLPDEYSLETKKAFLSRLNQLEHNASSPQENEVVFVQVDD